MQKYRFFFFFKIIIVFILILIFSNQAFAQSNSELVSLYENQQLLTLKEYYDNNKIYDPNWKLFIEALFKQNADSSLKIFSNVYIATQDKILRKFIVERISDYYYARGYYKTSERLLKDKKFVDEIISVENESKADAVNFGIQIGAFSSYENALKLKNKVLKEIKNVTIVNKDSNGENLYVVVIGKYSDRKSAESELHSLEEKNIRGFVIQY